MTFAKDTGVPVERSKIEIEKLLKRAGADSFLTGWDPGAAAIQFRLEGLIIRYVMPIPDAEDPKVCLSPAGRIRRGDALTKALEQVERTRWRALKLIIQAKLEAVEAGVTTLEREFLADVVMQDGTIFYKWALPQVREMYALGKPMPLLLSPGGES